MTIRVENVADRTNFQHIGRYRLTAPMFLSAHSVLGVWNFSTPRLKFFDLGNTRCPMCLTAFSRDAVISVTVTAVVVHQLGVLLDPMALRNRLPNQLCRFPPAARSISTTLRSLRPLFAAFNGVQPSLSRAFGSAPETSRAWTFSA